MFTTIRYAWNRIRTIARPFRQFADRWRAVTTFVVLVALLIAVSILNVRTSDVSGDFMSALAKRQVDQFQYEAFLYIGMFVVTTVVVVFARYLEERLGLFLREGLTHHLIGRYLAYHAYHRLTRRPDIDNPDQRITEDVKNFTSSALSFALILLNALLALIGFTAVLWRITPWLLLAAVLYAAFGTSMTIVLGRRLVGLNFLQLKKEADFRFRLMRVRGSSEAIAMQGVEPWESWRLNDRLQALVENFKRIIVVNRNLNFFTNGFNYLTAVIPVLVVAPLYFREEVEIGKVYQSIGAFTAVLNAFSVFVSQFQQLSAFAAGAERLGALVEAVDSVPEPTGPAVQETDDGARVAFDDLTLWTPDTNRVLIKNMTTELPPGRRLLVTGQNGAGKSALFLAAAGLWEWGQGRIVRPQPGDVMFLPQEPFIGPGTLRQQLFEGAGCRDLPDERIMQVFQEVKFEKVLDRVGGLDAERDRANVLSPGEQRLFALARLLLAKPKYAFIDAGVNGLTDFWIYIFYAALLKNETTYISVGDHPALRAYHDLVLDLEGEGDWNLSPSHAETAEKPA